MNVSASVHSTVGVSVVAGSNGGVGGCVPGVRPGLMVCLLSVCGIGEVYY